MQQEGGGGTHLLLALSHFTMLTTDNATPFETERGIIIAVVLGQSFQTAGTHFTPTLGQIKLQFHMLYGCWITLSISYGKLVVIVRICTVRTGDIYLVRWHLARLYTGTSQAIFMESILLYFTFQMPPPPPSTTCMPARMVLPGDCKLNVRGKPIKSVVYQLYMNTAFE